MFFSCSPWHSSFTLLVPQVGFPYYETAQHKRLQVIDRLHTATKRKLVQSHLCYVWTVSSCYLLSERVDDPWSMTCWPKASILSNLLISEQYVQHVQLDPYDCMWLLDSMSYDWSWYQTRKWLEARVQSCGSSRIQVKLQKLRFQAKVIFGLSLVCHSDGHALLWGISFSTIVKIKETKICLAVSHI